MNLWNPAQFEEKLAKRCLQGEARAWEELVHLYTRRIYNLAYRYLRNSSQAEDLTQDIFLRVYQTLSSYRAESGSLTNWLLRVGRNLIIDHYRQAKRHSANLGSEEMEHLDPADPKQTGPVERIRYSEDCRLLWKALGDLSPELREAVVLRDLEELSYQEIESILAVPQGTVKSRINRGRLELAKIMRRNQEPTGIYGTTAVRE